VELDESQHFSDLRKESLIRYPDKLQLGFDRNKWYQLCENIKAKDGNPVYRDEQRAWYDTLRDFLPLTKGLHPTIRIFMKDYNWCSLNPNSKEDIELFKSLAINEKKPVINEDRKTYKSELSNQVTIATACLKSNGI